MSTKRSENRLLDTLAPRDYANLAGRLEKVRLELGQVIYEPEDKVDWVYFPDSGLLSSVTVMLSGAMVETSVTGCEGAVGFVEATSSGIIFSRVFVQMPVTGCRVSAAAYRQAFNASAALRERIGAHIELMLAEAQQQIACHALHQAAQRLAWWLIECQDRAGGPDEMPLTQEFLADMLGCTRPTVSQVASELQNKGVISYSRGAMRILDRERLKQLACECYATTEKFRQTIEAWAKESAARSAA